MSYDKIKSLIEQQLAEIRAAGLYKTERVLLGPQGGSIRVAQGTVINLCANNYLGLADHPAIVEAAAHAVRMRGYGMASVRFICGTQDLHKDLERAITSFLGAGDTDRKSTRLNSSHLVISYAVFCLKKKKRY